MKEKMVVKMETVGLLPKDFAAAVKDIKLAILQSRALAAHASIIRS